MDQLKRPGVPRFIFILVPVILGLMFYYAAFIDSPMAEKTVNKFYSAYFTRDYDRVAENLSVFWAVRFLPQYETLPPAELLANRDKIVKETAAFIGSIEKENPVPKNVKIEILKDYTREGENSAIVAYQFLENTKKTSMEAAILIKEAGQYRIFNMTPVDTATLSQIKDVDMSILDKNFGELLNAKDASKE